MLQVDPKWTLALPPNPHTHTTQIQHVDQLTESFNLIHFTVLHHYKAAPLPDL